MYLQQFDAIVKEKCKQHKPMKIHNTSSLFSREAAIKFRNDSAKYEPQASGNLVGSQPGASYVGYQSGFKSAIGRDEIEINNREIKRFSEELEILIIENEALRQELLRQEGLASMTGAIASARRQRIAEARHRGQVYSDEAVATINQQGDRMQHLKNNIKQLISANVKANVRAELSSLKSDEIQAIYNKLKDKFPDSYQLDQIPQSGYVQKSIYANIITEFLSDNNMINNLVTSGEDYENIQVSISALTSSNDSDFNAVLKEAPRVFDKDDPLFYTPSAPRTSRPVVDPLEDEPEFLTDAARELGFDTNDGNGNEYVDGVRGYLDENSFPSSPSSSALSSATPALSTSSDEVLLISPLISENL